MAELAAALCDENGEQVGSLVVAHLPGRADPLGADPEDARRVVVAEGGTYRFQIDIGAGIDSVKVEPRDELFSFDDETLRRGRMQPRQHVGRVRIRVGHPASGREGWAELDVRPTKLSAEVEYRQMLEDITDVATEALLQGFAPAALSLTVDPASRPELLYQQFALLQARLASPELQGAIARVLNDPYLTWTHHVELQQPGRPIPASPNLGRAIARPGPRTPTHGRLAVGTVPQKLEKLRTDSSVDSIPNRFVMYALQRWRAVTQQLVDVLEAIALETGPVRRGREVAGQTLRQLDEHLGHPLFREVSELAIFPASNQVLHKQYGYREIFRAFVLGELGSRLSFDWDVDDAFSASQRNAATMYEYWTFLQLVEALGLACGRTRTVEAFAQTSDGLSLAFRQGHSSALKWRALAGDRQLDVQLFFNRTFLVSAQTSSESSWSRAMRPDASIRIRPLSHLPELDDRGDLDLWLHFDAKYRLEAAGAQFMPEVGGDAGPAEEAETIERVATTKREDLLKMHAYRDAIRRSAGAYVLYPGSDRSPPFREYAEVLPGLGAFVLRPGASGHTTGRRELSTFFEAVLEHAAERASQHERDRYWRARVYATPGGAGAHATTQLPDLAAPPADTPVLCGYVRGKAHEAWIRQTGIYNVRAGDRRGAVAADEPGLGAEWLLLYRDDGGHSLWMREGSWFVQTREQLSALGYPGPRGSVYLCAPVAESLQTPEWIEEIEIGRVAPRDRQPRRAPFVTSWARLSVARGPGP